MYNTQRIQSQRYNGGKGNQDRNQNFETASLEKTAKKICYQFDTVFEIKGAHCARRAHFRQRAHVFLSCAPGVCTFFSMNYYGYIQEECMDKLPGARFMKQCALMAHKIKP